MIDLYSRQRVAGFLHTDGRKMVNGSGEQILLRGWGAGNWLNPEGFLCGDENRPWSADDSAQVPTRFDRARSIEASVTMLCGSDYARSFWPRWYRNHLSEGDIRAMAEYGYNSVRLPLNARAFLAEEPGYHWNADSFAMLDQVLDWCEKYRLYAILDMHTTPGGQSAIKCDDGMESVPLLFLEAESRERTIRLWEEIARRYRDRWIVGGYDLLNEPLAPAKWYGLMPELIAFYQALIPRIRAIDKNHMLTIEGAAAATNMEIFDRNYDPACNNWCIHVHFYRLSPERRPLFRFLEASLRLNVPVWLGEGGGPAPETGTLLAAAEAYELGWCLWCWKTSTMPDGKLRRDPVQYRLPEGWSRILRCLYDGAPRPSYAECQQIFDEMLENMKFDNCILSPEQHNYLLRRPGRMLPAAAFDFEKGSFSGHWEFGNPYEYRTEDNMHLVTAAGCTAPRLEMPFDSTKLPPVKPLENLALVLEPGDYVTYTIRDIEGPCPVYITARAAENARLEASLDGKKTVLAIQASTVYEKYYLLDVPAGAEARLVLSSCAGRPEIRHVLLSLE